MLVAECSFGALRLPSELAQSALVLADILVVLLLDELDEVLHDPLVKVLTCPSSPATHQINHQICLREENLTKNCV